MKIFYKKSRYYPGYEGEYEEKAKMRTLLWCAVGMAGLLFGFYKPILKVGFGIMEALLSSAGVF